MSQDFGESALKLLKNKNISVPCDYPTICKLGLDIVPDCVPSPEDGGDDEFCPLTKFTVKKLSNEKIKDLETNFTSTASSTTSTSLESSSTGSSSSSWSTKLVSVPLGKSENDKQSFRVSDEDKVELDSSDDETDQSCLSRVRNIFGCFKKKDNTLKKDCNEKKLH